jgi:transcriptional regulator GlxA family with amidase domain
MKKATLVSFDNITDIDIFFASGLLNHIKFRNASFDVQIVGTAASHFSTCGIDLVMQDTVEASNDNDLVFFGGGSGSIKLITNEAYLQCFHLNPERQIICSMCSGALLVAALVHLNGLSATTYSTAFDALKFYAVKVNTDKHLFTHGNTGTEEDCLAAVDLISWATEKLYDTSVKNDVSASVLPIGQGQMCVYPQVK